MNSSNKSLFWLFFLYALIRIPLMLSPLEVTNDDMIRGMIATEVLHGFSLPIWDYIADPYGGGALFAGLWTAPSFYLFGKTMFALKMAPFLWHLLSIFAWYKVWRYHFTEVQTFFILLFFVVSPPQITRYSLFNSGYHFEMILWIALSILIFRSFIHGRWSGSWAGMALGFLGGFSTFLIPTNLMTPIVIWIYLFFVKEGPGKKTFCAFYLPGFLIGFSPWIYYNWLMKDLYWSGPSILFHLFSSARHLNHLVKSFGGLFFSSEGGLQELMGFHTFLGPMGAILDGIYVFLFVVGLFLLWKRNRFFWRENSKGFNIEIFGFFFQVLLLVLLVFEQSGVDFNFYLFPLIPFMGMTLVLISQEEKLRKTIVFFCFITSLIGNFGSVRLVDMGETLYRRGYSYQALLAFLEPKYAPSFSLFRKKFNKVIQSHDDEVKKVFYKNLDPNLLALEPSSSLQETLAFIGETPKKFQPLLYEKLGVNFMGSANFKLEKLKTLVEHSGIPKIYWPPVYSGAVRTLRSLDIPIEDKTLLAKDICNDNNLSERTLCYESFGLGNIDDMDQLRLDVEQNDPILSLLEERDRYHYIRGEGESALGGFRADPKGVKEIIQYLQDPYQHWFAEGLAQEIAHAEEDPFMRVKLIRRLEKIFQ